MRQFLIKLLIQKQTEKTQRSWALMMSLGTSSGCHKKGLIIIHLSVLHCEAMQA